MDLPALPFGLSIYLTSQSIASGIFALVAIFGAVISFILVWHWRRYGLKSPTIVVAEIIYLVGAVLLLAWAFVNLN